MDDRMNAAETLVKKRRGQGAEVWYRLRKNKGAMLGLGIVVLVALLAIFADVLFDYQTQIAGLNALERLQGPSLKHPFGTDEMGRDLFCRVLYGAKYSFFIGIISATGSAIIGIAIGAVCGYYGGKLDDIVMRLVDIWGSIPNVLLGCLMVRALGANMLNLMLAIMLTGFGFYARLARAQVMTVKSNEFVEAARCIGLREGRIIMTHILPNCLSPIIVRWTLSVASDIIAASSLSFLGLGVPVPSPEWGALLSAGRQFITSHPHLCLFPGLAIMILVLALNLFGDGLRDAMDPKLRK